MNYIGNLYGKVGRKYVPLKLTSADVDQMERELEQIKAILADPHAVHIKMLRGIIQWTPAQLHHLLGQEPPNSKETA